MYVDNLRLIGGYTIRYALGTMREDEVDDFLNHVPFSMADEVDPEDASVRFFDAIGNGEHELIAAMLAASPRLANQQGNIFEESSLGGAMSRVCYPLHYAAAHGDAEAVKLLLSYGADTEARDQYGFTCISEAAEHGHPLVIEVFAEAGADLNAGNGSNFPLAIAAGHGHLGTVETLLRLGANITNRNKNGCSALFYPDRRDIIELLIQQGVPLNDITEGTLTSALHEAVFRGWFEAAIALIERGINTEFRSDENETALEQARRMKRFTPEQLKRLEEAIIARASMPNRD